MVTSPTDGNLSNESGIVIGALGEFYPRTEEEPNYTEERYAAFIQAIFEDLSSSEWIVESRERYYPGPPNTGGGPGYVGELIKLGADHWELVLAIGVYLFPKEGENLGNKIKSGLSAIRFNAAWWRTCKKMNLQPQPLDFLSFLQDNIEGLCLLDAVLGRSQTEKDFRIVSVASTPHSYASAAHPSGPEIYRVKVSSTSATYIYRVDGRGRGEKTIHRRHWLWRRSRSHAVDLLEAVGDTAETACQL